jgi:hypothetical protein
MDNGEWDNLRALSFSIIHFKSINLKTSFSNTHSIKSPDYQIINHQNRSPFSIFNAPFFLHPHSFKKNVNKKTIKICWIAKNLFNIV